MRQVVLPHSDGGRPRRVGAGLRPRAQALPSIPARKAVCTILVVGQAGRRVGWSRPLRSLPRLLAGPD